jgi:hypothetical protein
MKIKRALSVADVEAFSPHILSFEGKWKESIGCPELTGSWIVWGGSVNGKTRFSLQLAKYLATFKRVAYNSLEEGLSQSIKKAIEEVRMKDVSGKFIFLDKEPLPELKERLRRRKSPEVVFIDSLQYTGLNYTEYKRLKEEFRHKLFVFISHADGREPKGNVGKAIKYDANVKIYVEGYKAFPQSRYGGGSHYIIWDKGATEYWDFK